MSTGSNLCKHAGGHSVITEACTSPNLTRQALCGMEVWKVIGTICSMKSYVASEGNSKISPSIDDKISKFGPKLHLCFVKVPIDF